jgi:hypothetical protein
VVIQTRYLSDPDALGGWPRHFFWYLLDTYKKTPQHGAWKVYKGRKPFADGEKVKALKENGLGASAIEKEMGVGRASVYIALGS